MDGDVVTSGEINIDDLVCINDNYGKTILAENGVEDEIVKYDFNGDGIVNILDRIILKSNYGKLAENITWQELNEPKEE